jgi:heme exporter protein C
MAATMLTGMLLMALAAWMYSIAASLMRARAIILEREADADWVRFGEESVAPDTAPRASR